MDDHDDRRGAAHSGGQRKARQAHPVVIRIPKFETVALLLVLGLLILAIVALAVYVRRFPWSGVGPVDFEGRTLWDWMELALVPAVLASLAVWFNAQERRRERLARDEVAAASQLRAQARTMDAALRHYVDSMNALVLDRGLGVSKNARIGGVARVLTLSALRQLDGERRGYVLQYLGESGLAQGEAPIVSLVDADFRGAVATYTNLDGINLSRSKLSESDFSGTDMRDAILYQVVGFNANFYQADLRRSDLRKSCFEGSCFVSVDLQEAVLIAAEVNGSDFRDANLQGAVLGGAQLTGCEVDGIKVDVGVELGAQSLSRRKATET